MGKSELFSHFADRFEVKRTQAREFFDELAALSEKELKRAGEFTLPGMVKLVVQKRKARMGRNPATGEAIKIPAKTVVKARIQKALKDAVLPRKVVTDDCTIDDCSYGNAGTHPDRLVICNRQSAIVSFRTFLAASRTSNFSILNFIVDSGSPR